MLELQIPLILHDVVLADDIRALTWETLSTDMRSADSNYLN